MRHKIGDDVTDIRVASAGLGALVDRSIDAIACELLAQQHIDASAHRARQVEPENLRDADIILVMEPEHRNTIINQVPEVRGRVFLLGKWNNDRSIPDPYRRSREYFERIYSLIDEDVENWLKAIRPSC